MHLQVIMNYIMKFGVIWLPALYYAPAQLATLSWIVLLYNEWFLYKCSKVEEDKTAIGDIMAGNARATVVFATILLIPTFIVGIMIAFKNESLAIFGGAGMVAVFADSLRLALSPKEKLESFMRRLVTMQNNQKKD